MLGNSIPEYVSIRLAITALRLVAPASLLYVATAAWTLTLPISPWIAVCAGAEALFYLGVWLPRKRRLQAVRTNREVFFFRLMYVTMFCFCDVFYTAPALETAEDDERGEGEVVWEVC